MRSNRLAAYGVLFTLAIAGFGLGFSCTTDENCLGGHCEIGTSSTGTCICGAGLYGSNCHLQYNGDMCANGATFNERSDSPCTCAPGYTGLYCDLRSEPPTPPTTTTTESTTELLTTTTSSSTTTSTTTLLSPPATELPTAPTFDCEDLNFVGQNCSIPYITCEECSSNSACIKRGDYDVCECRTGYGGVTCHLLTTCDTPTCGGGGNCSSCQEFPDRCVEADKFYNYSAEKLFFCENEQDATEKKVSHGSSHLLTICISLTCCLLLIAAITVVGCRYLRGAQERNGNYDVTQRIEQDINQEDRTSVVQGRRLSTLYDHAHVNAACDDVTRAV